MAAALAALSEHSVLSASDHPLISKLTGTWKGVPVVHPFWTNSASDEEEPDMEIKALQERLEDVIANKKNQTCAECPNKFPQWAVLDRGILVCSLCAGVHREGVSRQIRSLAYDTNTWAKEENVAALEAGGNAKNKAV